MITILVAFFSNGGYRITHIYLYVAHMDRLSISPSCVFSSPYFKNIVCHFELFVEQKLTNYKILATLKTVSLRACSFVWPSSSSDDAVFEISLRDCSRKLLMCFLLECCRAERIVGKTQRSSLKRTYTWRCKLFLFRHFKFDCVPSWIEI